MFEDIYMTAQRFKDEEYRELVSRILLDNREKLLYWPAAKTNHHAYKGGLLYHVFRMMKTGEALCDIYSVLDRDLLLTGIILHDIEKLSEYESLQNGMVEKYTVQGNLIGHLVMGVNKIEKYAEELGMTTEKKMLVEHMLLSHHGQYEFGSPVLPAFPEAKALHYIDNIDAKLEMMENELQSLGEGQISDKRFFGIDNSYLYRHK